MTRTVFPFTSPEIAFWISVSLSTSRDAVASSNRMTGASFKSARAMVSPLSNLFQFFHNKSKQLCLFPPSQKTDRHKKRSHLIDKGSGSAGTDTIHTLLYISTFKINIISFTVFMKRNPLCSNQLKTNTVK
mgnify:CR=1 FL=1